MLFADVQAALNAIAEPRRREILRLVRDHEMTAGTIASHFDVSQPAISQHLRVLHDAGLVSERREGTRRIYRARPEGLADVRAYLQEFWTDRLGALKAEAEAHERSGGGRRRRTS
jgi:DNA-binding transcriptional ArsR family regulator